MSQAQQGGSQTSPAKLPGEALGELPGEIVAWRMEAPGTPLVRRALPVPALGDGEVLVEVAGCGLCHTDLGFLYEGVATKHAPPVTLGHEISGRVVAGSGEVASWVGKAVVIPAVLPCGTCKLCLAGRGTACRKQRMLGNDIDGGFASHVVVPAGFLCPVDATGSLELWELGVIADAVSTPLQAAHRAGLAAGDVAVVIGVGGIGSYGVQIAAARGATVIAVDIDEQKLARVAQHGAAATVMSKGQEPRDVRAAVREKAKALGLDQVGWKVFEMSGSVAGQAAAYELLTFAGTVGFIGYTQEKLSVRLGNLMAFDATIFGNWGCVPELYPEAVQLVLSGKVQVRPFIRRFPLDAINSVIDAARAHELRERPILTPRA